MANMHGFGRGFGDDDPNRRQHRPNHQGFGMRGDDGEGGGIFDQEPMNPQHLRIANEHKVLFVSGQTALKDPRQENYWNMLVFGLCPTFKFLSITFLIILVDLIMFIIEQVKGLDKTSTNLLQVNIQTLIDLGANYQPNDLDGQAYRFLSAIFLHVHFLHIFGNVIVTFLFLSRVQYTFGPIRTLVVYLLSGIAANVFSVLISPDNVKAGASTSLYGIIGVIIGYVIINWRGLDLIGPLLKCQVWCTALMIIVFIFLFTPSNVDGSVDVAGHLGGALSGVWLSSINSTIISETREKIFRIVFASLFVIQVLVCFLVFYLTQTPVGPVL